MGDHCVMDDCEFVWTRFFYFLQTKVFFVVAHIFYHLPCLPVRPFPIGPPR
jgi:hypothetical protein